MIRPETDHEEDEWKKYKAVDLEAELYDILATSVNDKQQSIEMAIALGYESVAAMIDHTQYPTVRDLDRSRHALLATLAPEMYVEKAAAPNDNGLALAMPVCCGADGLCADCQDAEEKRLAARAQKALAAAAAREARREKREAARFEAFFAEAQIAEAQELEMLLEHELESILWASPLPR